MEHPSPSSSGAIDRPPIDPQAIDAPETDRPKPQAVPWEPDRGYRVGQVLNLYDGPTPQRRLATQAWGDRHLRITGSPVLAADGVFWPVVLAEDGYPGWICQQEATPALTPGDGPPPHPVPWTPGAIAAQIPAIIAFTQAALGVPNCYRWGGTVAPDYDCSGLMQAAFHSVGIWIPRDAYQQEAFAQALPCGDSKPWESWQPGDLVFFGSPDRATHVGLYLGNGRYIHSSGKDQGRNGIGIDRLDVLDGDPLDGNPLDLNLSNRNPLDLNLSDRDPLERHGQNLEQKGDRPAPDPISQAYARQLRGAGRIVRSLGG